ncbi:hypothetical protein B0H63DRAFT_519911 [Podospora didyma]|uniref:Uncharacterized protein n=1 Tax=Podospora didyma TaxID=330526 RepID=A0AAE0U4V9_9PEZI|nr:hypothetical protein B0H63DRAFT_519911 [Podospora didyma]
MKPITALLSLAALATAASAAPMEERMLLMGIFRTSQTWGCPLQNPELFQIGLGAESPDCRTFYNNTTYAAINVETWVPQCLLTLHNTYDCKDPGIVSGLGCWSPEGGIKGYTATCPWKTW